MLDRYWKALMLHLWLESVISILRHLIFLEEAIRFFPGEQACIPVVEGWAQHSSVLPRGRYHRSVGREDNHPHQSWATVEGRPA